MLNGSKKYLTKKIGNTTSNADTPNMPIVNAFVTILELENLNLNFKVKLTKLLLLKIPCNCNIFLSQL